MDPKLHFNVPLCHERNAPTNLCLFSTILHFVAPVIICWERFNWIELWQMDEKMKDLSASSLSRSLSFSLFNLCQHKHFSPLYIFILLLLTLCIIVVATLAADFSRAVRVRRMKLNIQCYIVCEYYTHLWRNKFFSFLPLFVNEVIIFFCGVDLLKCEVKIIFFT